MIRNGKILAMHDERSPYFYLPGGRVKIGGMVECAIVRDVEEELGIALCIIFPLWANPSFFTEDVDNLNYNDFCFYFLLDVVDTGY